MLREQFGKFGTFFLFVNPWGVEFQRSNPKVLENAWTTK